jgi:hypothetical protein
LLCETALAIAGDTHGESAVWRVERRHGCSAGKGVRMFGVATGPTTVRRTIGGGSNQMNRKTAGLSAVTAIVMAVLAGCANGAQSDAPAGNFDDRLKAGAPCSELFAIRNELDWKTQRYAHMNEQLRAVGCYLSTSERTD